MTEQAKPAAPDAAVRDAAVPDAAVRDAAVPELRIVSRNATGQDVAAVTAVLQAALEELANAEAATAGPRISAWARSQRAGRETLSPGAGAWRSFSG